MLCSEHGESFDDPSLHHDLESGSLLSLLGIREEDRNLGARCRDPALLRLVKKGSLPKFS